MSQSVEISPQDIELKHDISLEYICELVPKKDKDGKFIEYDYQKEVSALDEQTLSRYGKGPFCYFSIPSKYFGKSGVYFIFENNNLKYIGECSNLETRFNEGYGVIFLQNSLLQGQQTNCRLNNLILESNKNRNKISLFFYESAERKEFEKEMILTYHTEWNLSRQSKSLPQKSVKPTTISQYSGKYYPIYHFLQQSDQTILKVTFSDIEKLLGMKLPDSARNYLAWWANDKYHSQAKSWLSAGWTVKTVVMGQHVIFRKA